MGMIVHKTLIVIGNIPQEDKNLFLAHEKAVKLGLNPSAIITAGRNGYASFFVGPSGSKVGWDAHDAHVFAMSELIKYIEDDTRYLDYAEVHFDHETPRIHFKRTSY